MTRHARWTTLAVLVILSMAISPVLATLAPAQAGAAATSLSPAKARQGPTPQPTPSPDAIPPGTEKESNPDQVGPVEPLPNPPTSKDISPEAVTLAKIDPLLRDTAEKGGLETILVKVLASSQANLSRYGSSVASGKADPLGYTHILLRVPARYLIKLASDSEVAAVAYTGPRPGPEPPDPEAPGAQPQGRARTAQDMKLGADRLQQLSEQRRHAQPVTAPKLSTSVTPVAPEGWFEDTTQGVYRTWAMGVTGQGDVGNPVKYAVLDTGVDFCNASLIGRWAVQPFGLYNNWPIAYDDRSAADFLTNYPNPGAGYGGNWGWYVRATNLTPEGPFVDPLYGKTYLTPGTSVSGMYRFGYHPDSTWHLLAGSAITNSSPVILVADTLAAGVYNTVYIDANWDGLFDMTVSQSNPAGCADWTGPGGGPDGVADDSYGLLYWMSDGLNPLPGVNMLYGGVGGTPIPAPGEVLMFMINDVAENGGNHGTLCASSAAGYEGPGVFYDPTGTLAPFAAPWIIAGPGSGGPAGPGAKIIAMGNFYAGGDSFSDYLFTLFGYDGVIASGDEANITSLSFGSGAEDADAWDFQSEYLSALNLYPEQTMGLPSPLYVKSSGNGGHGYGTVNTPGSVTGLSIGASTQYGPYKVWGTYEGVTLPGRANYQDVQPWSDRGPSAMSMLAPHVVANGAWGSGAIPTNEATYYNGYDGAAAWEMWGGTSRSAPVAAGMAALVYDAYWQGTGAYPDWRLAREFIMNGTLDIKYDEKVAGAGQAYALRSAQVASGTYGVYVSPPFYQAGSYPPGSGQRFESFAMGMLPGQTDVTTFTLKNPTAAPIAVNLRDEQLQQTVGYTATLTTIPGDPTTNYDNGAPNYLLNLTNWIVANPNADLMIVRVAQPMENFDTVPPTPSSFNNRWRDVIYNVFDVNGNGIWWNDLNLNGRVEISPTVPGPLHELDPGDEYIRFTYSYLRGTMQEMRVQTPFNRMGSGGVWLGLARATGNVPTTFQIEVLFYEEEDWNQVSVTPPVVVVPPGTPIDPGQAVFTATINAFVRGATLFTENFDSPTPPALPAGWATMGVITGTGTLPDWFTNAGTHHPSGTAAHSAPNLAYFNSYHVTSPKSARLYQTSGLNLSGLSGADVSFWIYHDAGYTSNADRVQVQVCTNGSCLNNADWINVGPAFNRYDGSTGWKQHKVSLSAYTGLGMTDVRIGFLGISAYGNDVHLDDVEVYEVTLDPPGEYMGRIVVFDPGAPGYDPHDIIIPVEKQVWVNVNGDPVFGGTPRANTPYDNGYIYGAFDWTGRGEAGDWRVFGMVVTNTAPGSVLLVDNTWQDYPTDIDTLLLDQVPSWNFALAGGTGGPPGPYPYRWFGPYTMDDLGHGSLRYGVRPNWRYTTTAGINHEFISAPAYDGLRMMLHEAVLYGGHQTAVPFTTTVAAATLSPNPIVLDTGITCVSNTVTMTFKSGLALPEGLTRGGAFGWFRPLALEHQPIYQDNPVSPTTASWVYPLNLASTYRLEIATRNAVNAPDIDLYLVRDNNHNGVWDAGDTQVASSGASGSDESLTLKGLADGDYLIAVHGFSVVGSPGFFDIRLKNIHGTGVMTISGLPASVIAGQLYTFTLHVDVPPEPGYWEGLLLFGPSLAPQAIEVPVQVWQGAASKLANQHTLVTGDLVTYTMVLTGSPGLPKWWNLTDLVPSGMQFVSVSGATFYTSPDRIEWGGYLPQALLGENFDLVMPDVLPSGWATATVTYTTGTSPTWLTNAGTHHPSGYAAHSAPNLAWFNSFHTSGNPSLRLYRTSGVDLSGASRAELSFWMFHDTGYATDPDRVQVQVCTNGSCVLEADWSNAGPVFNRYDGSLGWKKHYVDVSAFAGPGYSDVRFGFLGISDYGNDIHIDDVILEYPTAGNTHTVTLTLRATGIGNIINVADAGIKPNSCPVADSVFVMGYGVTVAPPTVSQAGLPGALVTYTLRMTNTGNVADTFTLTVTGNAWTTDVPSSIGPLAAGAGTDVQVVVHIPSSASGGATDTAIVAATSQGDPAQTDSSTLTTTANASYGVTVMPPTVSQAGLPGTLVTYTLRVTNTGNVADTFTMTVAGNAWTTDVPLSIGPLAAGAGTDVQVVVHIPSSASGGATDTAAVTARSQGDPARFDSAVLTTSISCIPVSGVDVTFTPAAPRVGETVTLTGTIVAGTLPITYTWALGDGNVGSGQVTTHVFPITNTLRTYTVTLTVNNVCNSAQAQKLVVVTPRYVYLPITLE